MIAMPNNPSNDRHIYMRLLSWSLRGIPFIIASGFFFDTPTMVIYATAYFCIGLVGFFSQRWHFRHPEACADANRKYRLLAISLVILLIPVAMILTR